ncbi:unnamed protein product [Parajaminaea phylloscopi]
MSVVPSPDAAAAAASSAAHAPYPSPSAHHYFAGQASTPSAAMSSSIPISQHVSASQPPSSSPPDPSHPDPDSSLFSSEEARFMTDSFASAQAFDPFQYGAPGFKVPAVLPPGLIHSLTAPGNNIGSSLRHALVNGSGASPLAGQQPWHGRQRLDGSSPASIIGSNYPGSSSMSPPNHPHHPHSQPWGASPAAQGPGLGATRASGTPGQPGQSATNDWAPGSLPLDANQRANNSGESFEDFVRRSSLQGAGASGASLPDGMPMYRHAASFSGPSRSVDVQPGPWQMAGWQQQGQTQREAQLSRSASGAYGQNRAWQLQQLEALQAERRRFTEAQQPSTSEGAHEVDRVAHTPAAYPTPYIPHQALPSSSAPGPSRDPLSTLGLSFPSSHDFPAASPPDGSTSRAVDGPSSIGGRLADGDSEMVDDRAHARAGNGHRGDGSRITAAGSSAQQKGILSDGNKGGSAHEAHLGDEGDQSDSAAALYRPWPKAPSPSEPSEVYPPLKLNLTALDRDQLQARFPHREDLKDAFFGRDPAQERRLYQPHLVDLKERRKEARNQKSEMLEEKRRKALLRQGVDPDAAPSGNDDAVTGATGSDSIQPGDDAGAGSDGGAGKGSAKAKKPPHVLLTEAEKKANHIASEQKRRANIRKGYEMLCAGVPALREALEKEDGEEGDDDNKGANAAMSGAGEGGSGGGQGYDVGGERLDGRAGPRSEAVVLGKSVEHLRHLLEIHRDLRSRRDHARVKLARNSFSIEVLVGVGTNPIQDLAVAAGGKAGKASGPGRAKTGNDGSKGKNRGSQQAQSANASATGSAKRSGPPATANGQNGAGRSTHVGHGAAPADALSDGLAGDAQLNGGPVKLEEQSTQSSMQGMSDD